METNRDAWLAELAEQGQTERLVELRKTIDELLASTDATARQEPYK